jgi:PilZ domain
MQPQDRRRTPRYPFQAMAELVENNPEAKHNGRVTELGLNGCFVEMKDPFAEGATLAIKLFTPTEFFEARATVAYATPQGVGLTFREVKPFFVAVLKKWLLSAMLSKRPAQT